MTVLAGHVDTPDHRHRLTLLDEHRLRCHDCQRTLLLPSGVASTSTSRSAIPGPGEPRCLVHEHEHHVGCRPCAADAKVNPDADAHHGHTSVIHQPTADVHARAAEARALLLPPRPALDSSRAFDPERMAAARAELDALRPKPDPEPEPVDDAKRMAQARAEVAARQPVATEEPEPADV